MAVLFFVTLIPFAVVGFILHAKFLKSLREYYPEIWTSLGSPSFWNNSPHNSLSVLRFLLKAEFRHLDDREFVQLGERLRVWTLVYLFGFGGLLVVALIWTIYNG